jgi:hypothetical protein
MDRHSTTPFAVLDPETTDPGDGGRHDVRPLAGRHAGTEVDEGVASRIALPVPGPPPPDGDLQFDHRFEPVDVGTFEEAGLDHTHGSGRIASWRRLDCVA